MSGRIFLAMPKISLGVGRVLALFLELGSLVIL